MNGNGWFFVGALVGIVVTVAFEVILAVVFDLPSRGIDDDAPSASEVVAGHTAAVRLHVAREFPCDECIPGRGLPAVVDLRGTAATAPQTYTPVPEMYLNIRHGQGDTKPDAGHVTVGQALGVALLALAFLAAMSFVGAVETAGVGM